MVSFILRPTIRKFLFRFFAVFALVEVFLTIFPPIHYQQWLASSVAGVLGLSSQGIFIYVNGFAFEISAFCTGLSTWGLWLGLLYGFSFPRGVKKIKYALFGLGGIILVNFFRLVGIVYAGTHYSFVAVDTLHTLTWFIMSALVLGAWYALLSVHLKTRNSEKIAQFLLNGK